MNRTNMVCNLKQDLRVEHYFERNPTVDQLNDKLFCVYVCFVN